MANWKNVIGKFAPMLGSAIGGDFGSMAVSMAVKALGMPVGTTEDALAIAVQSMGPDDRLALMSAENDFVVRKAEIFAQMKRDEHADRSDARQMVLTDYKWIMPILALIAVLGFLGVLFALVFFGASVSAGTHDVLMVMVGVLGTLTTGVYAYYFGSSSGSKAKTELLGK